MYEDFLKAIKKLVKRRNKRLDVHNLKEIFEIIRHKWYNLEEHLLLQKCDLQKNRSLPEA